jgi:threonine dehydrogenase-like Zn-dependent dehydrogenase
VHQLTFVAPHELVWDEVPEPEIDDPRAALVRPVAVASCDLDAGIVAGSAPLPGPFAFGHEFVADVVEVGAGVRHFAAGQRVVVSFQINCGSCDPCLRGLTASCARVPLMASYGLAPLSREYGGALSDLVAVPYADAMLVALPDGVDPAAAASASDNIPDGWRAVAPLLVEQPGAPVLVLGGAGSGSVGLYAAGIAVALGSVRVDYVDNDPIRLRAAELMGAHVIEGPIGKRYGPYPITVNHSADPSGLTTALRSTAAGGTCTSTTVYFGSGVTIPMLEMYTSGVTLTTSRVSARAAIPHVLDLIASGRLHPELVTAQTGRWDDAAELLARHTHKTVIVRPGLATTDPRTNVV